MSVKKLLVLTPRFPYPVVGGDRLRIYNVCKALSREFSLTLLSLCESDAEIRMTIPDDGVFDRVERIRLTRFRSFMNVLAAIPSRVPLQVAYYRSAKFARAVERLVGEHDGVLAHLIRCGEYVRGLNRPRVLEMTDAISLNYQRVRRLSGKKDLKRLVYSLESRRLLAYEREIVKDFELAVLVSEADKRFLAGDGGLGNVLVCSNGVDYQKLPFQRRESSKSVLAYIGNMTSVQNMDACLFFAEEVLPLLQSDALTTLRVVGRIDDADAARLSAFPNVEVTGQVADIAAAVSDARAGVCPVRLAAGVQNKILEYMALGLPVVTSSIGLEGLDAVPEKHLLVADTPAEYRQQVSRIWNDYELARRLASDARLYVTRHHEWDRQLRPLVDRVACLLGRKDASVQKGRYSLAVPSPVMGNSG